MLDPELEQESMNPDPKHWRHPRLIQSVMHRGEVSVADPDPGSGAFWTPGFGMGKKSGSVSGMNNPDHIS
jgi:hypothetical protein